MHVNISTEKLTEATSKALGIEAQWLEIHYNIAISPNFGELFPCKLRNRLQLLKSVEVAKLQTFHSSYLIGYC